MRDEVNDPKAFPPHRIPAVDGAEKCALWPRILSPRISGVRGQLNGLSVGVYA